MQEKTEKLNSAKDELRKELKEKTVGYIMAAMGIVTGLAWNEAIKALIDRVFPFGTDSGLLAKFVYAVLVTLIIVVISYFLLRFSKKEQPKM